MPSDQELPHIYTVSGLTREIRDRLETHFSLVWVSGEVSNFRQPLSGHYYFTLKDAGAQLRAVLFRSDHLHLRYKPQEGSQILCRGRITVYEPRGEYQLIVDYLEPLGLGALAQAFEALKTRLQAEGLFEAALKKPLPFLPRRLALVTSPTGAVVRDFLRLMGQRYPNLEVLIYPVKVQGPEAAGEISPGVCTALLGFLLHALVPLAPPACEADLHLGLALLEVDSKGDQRVAALGALADDAPNLAAVHKELAGALRLVLLDGGLLVRRDVHIVEEEFVPLGAGEGFVQAARAVAEAFRLAADEDHAGLVGVGDFEVVPGLAVLADDLDVLLLGAHGTSIIALGLC